jgi:hypothetical protein
MWKYGNTHFALRTLSLSLSPLSLSLSLYFGIGRGKAEINEVYRSVLAVEDIFVLIYSTALL